jgi:hypothetical protein
MFCPHMTGDTCTICGDLEMALAYLDQAVVVLRPRDLSGFVPDIERFTKRVRHEDLLRAGRAHA